MTETKTPEVTISWDLVTYLNEILFDYTFWMREHYRHYTTILGQWRVLSEQEQDEEKKKNIDEELEFLKTAAEKLDIWRLRCDQILLLCRDALDIKTDLDEDIEARRVREEQARNRANEQDAAVSEDSEVLPTESKD